MTDLEKILQEHQDKLEFIELLKDMIKYQQELQNDNRNKS